MRFFLSKNLFVSIFVITLLFSCSGGKMEEENKHYNAFDEVSAKAWEKLSAKKIYFGHQSVGFNIIDGIKELMKEQKDIKLNITEATDLSNSKKGVFLHSRIGKNTDPISKLNNFIQLMDNNLGNHVDIAFMKFCYVDITAKTDVEKLFTEYKISMEKLIRKYPKTRFIHCSVPLTTSPETWKTKLKKLLGKDDIWEFNDSKQKDLFNMLMRNEYAQNGTFFDIAKIESTFPDGKLSGFTHNDKEYATLVPEYTYDGGHLNELGRKKVAKQLLLYLVNLH